MISGKTGHAKIGGTGKSKQIIISGTRRMSKNSGVPGNPENHDIREKRDIRKMWPHIRNHVNAHIPNERN